jgi:hypothetical protein
MGHPAVQAEPGNGVVEPPPAPGVARRSIALGVVILTVALIAAAGLALALRTGLPSRPASQLVVQGRVTGTDGKPVSGIKVWLNAWPKTAPEVSSQRPVPVTVVGSVTTSATGTYAMTVLSPAALAPEAANGIIKFMVMTGDSAGWDAASFSRRLVLTAAGTTKLALPPGSIRTVDLHLTPKR